MIPYIINVGLILAGCLAFYKLLLQKETFYRLNRYVLMLCLIIAFSLPLVPVPQQLSLRKVETPVVSINNTSHTTTATAQPGKIETPAQKTAPVEPKTFSWQQVIQWAAWLYWFGVCLLTLNFLLQLGLLLYRAYKSPVIKDGRFRIVEMKGDKAPCSFGNTIFINPSKYEWSTYNQILQHEKVHVQQNHSIDIILAEFVIIFQWFNPFAWLYRKEVENNLEFLTDDQLVQSQRVEKQSYQLSLLKVSAPHLPLSLTTNYNQSLLKKRIAMMNSKRSSVHTAWKYFFLLPLLIVFASLMNEPLVKAQNEKNVENKKNDLNSNENNDNNRLSNEGYWFATIKDNKVNIQFRKDQSDHNSYSGDDFSLSDFPNLPRGTNGDFKLTREAGTMNFNGKFEGDQGMGKYKFEPNKEFGSYISSQGVEKPDDDDLMTFFFVNLTKGYVQMLKDEGYSKIDKDKLIGVRALGVDKDFIESMKQYGYKDVELEQLTSLKALGVNGAFIKEIKDAGYNNVEIEQLTSLKALGVDAAYIKEIKDAGYKDVELEQLVSFKAQGIDKDYLAKLPKSKGDGGKMDAEDVVSMKALNVDEAYVNSFKQLGYTDIDPEQLVSMKAVGVTPEYVKEFEALGYKNIDAEDLVSMKAQDITPAFIKQFEAAGYKNIPADQLSSLKALGVQPDYIQSFKNNGYNDISLEDAVSMKAQNITPAFIKQFEDIGFKNISLDDAVALKAVGVTPEWIKDMKSKGFNYNDVSKYITLKSIQ